MNNENLSCVFIHKGYQPYLKYNLKITSKYNNVYLIGDDSLKPLANISNNIKFVNITRFENSNQIRYFYQNFKNYSSNSFEFEWFCFARIFILNEFMKEYKLERIFYSDSDNILLKNVNNLCFNEEIAYIIPKQEDKHRMSASIHSSLINSEFCNEFTKLFQGIYIDKTKFQLIEDKIKYHNEKNVAGGICDMTLYFLLFNEGKLKIQNLLIPFSDKSGNEIVFMNQINTGEGYKANKNYEMKRKKLKIYSNGYIRNIMDDKKIAIGNIHFQGASKKNLNRFTKLRYQI